MQTVRVLNSSMRRVHKLSGYRIANGVRFSSSLTREEQQRLQQDPDKDTKERSILAILDKISEESAQSLTKRQKRQHREQFIHSHIHSNYEHAEDSGSNVYAVLSQKGKKFRDKIRMKVTPGKGGDGCVSFGIGRGALKPPDGGQGGRGGDVLIVAKNDARQLETLKNAYKAKHGQNGSSQGQNGKNGADCVIEVPVGTVVSVFDTERDTVSLLEDMDTHNKSVMCGVGGNGGRGNIALSTRNKTARHAEKGEIATDTHLLLELKTIADVGLVGFPNSGKSTLLRALSNAKPKVASYAFTTIHPTVGVVEYDFDKAQLFVADLPGLLEDAHLNRGLGHEFLRHIERTSVLCFVIDMTPPEESVAPFEQFLILRKEIEMYSEEMLTRPYIVVGNKSDQVGSSDVYQEFVANVINMYNRGELKEIPPMFHISAKDKKNILDVKDALRKCL